MDYFSGSNHHLYDMILMHSIPPTNHKLAHKMKTLTDIQTFNSYILLKRGKFKKRIFHITVIKMSIF